MAQVQNTESEEEFLLVEKPTLSVLVANLPTTADLEQQLKDFFSYCGDILSFQVNGNEASIQFQSTDSAKSALLLNGATLSGSVISVVPTASGTLDGEQKAAPVQATPEPPSQSSVVEALRSAGYQLSLDAAQQAKLYDEQFQISNKAQSLVSRLDEQVQTLDKEYKISENAQTTMENFGKKIQEVEEEYHIGAGINQAIAAAITTGELARDVIVARSAETSTAIHNSTENLRNQSEAVTTSVLTSAVDAIDSLQLQERGEAVVSSIQNFVETNEMAQSTWVGLQNFALTVNATVQGWVAPVESAVAPGPTEEVAH